MKKKILHKKSLSFVCPFNYILCLKTTFDYSNLSVKKKSEKLRDWKKFLLEKKAARRFVISIKRFSKEQKKKQILIFRFIYLNK